MSDQAGRERSSWPTSDTTASNRSKRATSDGPVLMSTCGGAPGQGSETVARNSCLDRVGRLAQAEPGRSGPRPERGRSAALPAPPPATNAPCALASAANASASRVLPMPASPTTRYSEARPTVRLRQSPPQCAQLAFASDEQWAVASVAWRARFLPAGRRTVHPNAMS